MNDGRGLKILTGAHHSVLRQELVEDTTDWPAREVVEKMAVLMDRKRGVGLAANQVGITDPFFIMYAPGWDAYRLFVNPKIEDLGGKQKSATEGCLSCPGIKVPVRRFTEVTLSYSTPTGERDTSTFTGYEARIAQHEMDHLMGILILDHKRKKKR